MYSRPEAAALVLCVKVLTALSEQYPLALDKAVPVAMTISLKPPLINLCKWLKQQRSS
jgi:hypothetical protein